jgi:hypothetical protein
MRIIIFESKKLAEYHPCLILQKKIGLVLQKKIGRDTIPAVLMFSLGMICIYIRRL